jgi:hypothetical protein
MGFGHCKDKKLMVYAEKCGAFDIGCKKWKYSLSLPQSCHKQ